MGNDLQIFRNGIFEITVKLENGECIFDVERVAKSLGITQMKNGVEYVRWERVNEYLKFSPQVGKGDFIPESAVYKLAFKASNEIAEKFQNWIAIDILPAIRRTGQYQMLPRSYADALRELAATVDEKERLEEQNKLMAPKVEFYDSVAGSKDAIEMAHASKVLGIKGFGRNNLFDFLREKEVLDKNNIPYQRFIDSGYFRTIEQKYNTPKGEIKINIKTLVYQKGLDYIRKLIEKEKLN